MSTPTAKVDLEALVRPKYPLPEWALFYELNKGVGWRGTEGRIDMAAINCWPSKHHTRVAFEMKRSRGDWLKELRNPTKRKWVEENFHETWFVVAHGIVKDAEVPEGWGLMVATKRGDKLIKRIQSRHRDVGELNEGLAISAIRALSGRLQEAEFRHYYFEGVTILTQEHVDALVKQHINIELAMKREGLEARASAVAKMQKEADAFRKEYTAPLMRLAQIVDGWWKRRSLTRRRIDLTRVDITVEDVEQWAADVRRDAIKKVLVEVAAAHKGLGELLLEAEEHNLKPKLNG